MTTTTACLTALRKRNGEHVPFNLDKLERAVAAAGAMTGEFGAGIANMVAKAVEVYLADLDELDADKVQEFMECQLMEAGFFRTARACILYRERRQVQAAANDGGCIRVA